MKNLHLGVTINIKNIAKDGFEDENQLKEKFESFLKRSFPYNKDTFIEFETYEEEREFNPYNDLFISVIADAELSLPSSMTLTIDDKFFEYAENSETFSKVTFFEAKNAYSGLISFQDKNQYFRANLLDLINKRFRNEKSFDDKEFENFVLRFDRLKLISSDYLRRLNYETLSQYKFYEIEIISVGSNNSFDISIGRAIPFKELLDKRIRIEYNEISFYPLNRSSERSCNILRRNLEIDNPSDKLCFDELHRDYLEEINNKLVAKRFLTPNKVSNEDRIYYVNNLLKDLMEVNKISSRPDSFYYVADFLFLFFTYPYKFKEINMDAKEIFSYFKKFPNLFSFFNRMKKFMISENIYGESNSTFFFLENLANDDLYKKVMLNKVIPNFLKIQKLLSKPLLKIIKNKELYNFNNLKTIYVHDIIFDYVNYNKIENKDSIRLIAFLTSFFPLFDVYSSILCSNAIQTYYDVAINKYSSYTRIISKAGMFKNTYWDLMFFLFIFDREYFNILLDFYFDNLFIYEFSYYNKDPLNDFIVFPVSSVMNYFDSLIRNESNDTIKERGGNYKNYSYPLRCVSVLEELTDSQLDFVKSLNRFNEPSEVTDEYKEKFLSFISTKFIHINRNSKLVQENLFSMNNLLYVIYHEFDDFNKAIAERIDKYFTEYTGGYGKEIIYKVIKYKNERDDHTAISLYNYNINLSDYVEKSSFIKKMFVSKEIIG